MLKSIKKIYLVFYISLLEPALDGIEMLDNIKLNKDTEQEYKVEEILDKI